MKYFIYLKKNEKKFIHLYLYMIHSPSQEKSIINQLWQILKNKQKNNRQYIPKIFLGKEDAKNLEIFKNIRTLSNKDKINTLFLLIESENIKYDKNLLEKEMTRTMFIKISFYISIISIVTNFAVVIIRCVL